MKLKNFFITGFIFFFLVAYGNSAVFKDQSFEDFAKGSPDGITVHENGSLGLGPSWKLKYRGDSGLNFTSILETKNKALLAAASPGGVVLRWDNGIFFPQFFSTHQDMILSMGELPNGNVLIATAPKGKLFIWNPASLLPETYAIFPDSILNSILITKNKVYIATSGAEGGGIWQADLDSKNFTEVFHSKEQVTCFASLKDGNVYFGTESNQGGALYRLGKKPFAIYSPEKGSISQIVPFSKQALWIVVTSQNKKGKIKKSKGNHHVFVRKLKSAKGKKIKIKLKRGSQDRLILFSLNGKAKEIELPKGVTKILDIRREKNTKGIWITTGKGKSRAQGLYRYRPEKGLEWIARFPESKALSLFSSEEHLYIGTNKPGGLYVMTPGSKQNKGIYRSVVMDGGAAAKWGKLSGQTQSGIKVPDIFMDRRFGNTSEPGPGWSPWLPSPQNPPGPSRYTQYRLRLNKNTKRKVSRISQFFEPSFPSLSLQSPTAEYLLSLGPTALGKIKLSDKKQNKTLNEAKKAMKIPSGEELPDPLKTLRAQVPFQNDVLIQWRKKLNGPTQMKKIEIRYRLYYQRKPDQAWIPLTKKIHNTAFLWNTFSMPEGNYRVKIQGSLVNHSSSDTVITQWLRVDHEAPVILKKEKTDRGIKLEVSDLHSILKTVLYRMTSWDLETPWKALLPLDGVMDERQEKFFLKLPNSHSKEKISWTLIDAKGNLRAYPYK